MPVGQEVPQMTDETNNPPSASLGGRERESLRSSETRYRRLFEAARDGILIVDTASRKITDVNPYMSELLGYSPAELLGKELWEIGLLKDAEANRISQSSFPDRKSTRLNSSHVRISYAVFC